MGVFKFMYAEAVLNSLSWNKLTVPFLVGHGHVIKKNKLMDWNEHDHVGKKLNGEKNGLVN